MFCRLRPSSAAIVSSETPSKPKRANCCSASATINASFSRREARGARAPRPAPGWVLEEDGAARRLVGVRLADDFVTECIVTRTQGPYAPELRPLRRPVRASHEAVRCIL